MVGFKVGSTIVPGLAYQHTTLLRLTKNIAHSPSLRKLASFRDMRVWDRKKGLICRGSKLLKDLASSRSQKCMFLKLSCFIGLKYGLIAGTLNWGQFTECLHLYFKRLPKHEIWNQGDEFLRNAYENAGNNIRKNMPCKKLYILCEEEVKIGV